MRFVDANNDAVGALSGLIAPDAVKGAERLCRPPCARIIVPCPEDAACCKNGWVHKNSMRHECPESADVTGSGLVLYGSQAAMPAT